MTEVLYQVNVPTLVKGSNFQFDVLKGGVVFGLGANGTGKSSFVSLLARNNSKKVTRLTGNREITLSSSSVAITGKTRNDYEQYFQSALRRDATRYYSDQSRQLTESIMYDLKEADSYFISKNYNTLLSPSSTEAGIKENLSKFKIELSPLKKVEDILRSGGLNFDFSYNQTGVLECKDSNGVVISVNMLSDGERAAFLMAARVITAPVKQLILLDEPERHLHRSISSPLIRALLDYRPDCSFMIVTHDLSLPKDFSDSQILLFRDFVHPNKWSVEKIETLSAISEDVVNAILGSKEKLLFVEG